MLVTVGEREILRRLDRIERLLLIEGNAIMSEIDEAAGRIEAAEDTLLADLTRELGDLANAVAGKLSDEEKARLDAIVQRLTDADAQIVAADPAPASDPAPTA